MYTNFAVILTLSLLTMTQNARAAGLERLFTTAQERQELDDGREHPPPPPETVPTAPLHITFNGLVTRSDGAATVWINGGEELSQPGFNIEIEKREDLSVPITLTKSRQEIRLKPGQTVSTLDGKITENLTSAPQSKDLAD